MSALQTAVPALQTAVTAQQSAPVTHWPARIAWTLALLALLLALYALMLRGWRRRAARQVDLPPLPAVPAGTARTALSSGLAPVEGIYVSSTTAGDWLDRIVARGLGTRSAAVLQVRDDGVLIERTGAPDVFIPAGALVGVRLGKGMAGKFVEEDGLLVLTWRHGERMIDTGFRARSTAAHAVLRDTVAGLSMGGAR